MNRNHLRAAFGLIFLPSYCQNPLLAQTHTQPQTQMQYSSPVPDPAIYPNAAYQLFRTQNAFTLLKLDTRTGQIWQIVWSTVDFNKRLVIALNNTVLAPDASVPSSPGRFILTHTENPHYFLLMDEADGRTWQVEWGDDGYRSFLPIPLNNLSTQ